MQNVRPKVFLVASTTIRWPGMGDYLNAIGASPKNLHQGDDTEVLIEAGGRLCYKSWEPGMNPNVTKVRQGTAYLENIIAQRHGSVLEHASATFIFHNVSRVFTHELVRHRAGCAVSQESMRYMRPKELRMFFPPDLDATEGAREMAQKTEDWFLKVSAWLDTVQSFDTKKRVTSALRRLLPQGTATDIMWTANMRALRHILELRTHASAEEEMRMVFDAVGLIVTDQFPTLFADFTRNDAGEWQAQYSKI